MTTIPDPQSEAPAAPSAKTDLPVEGMTCASCVRRIEKALGAAPGVKQATVNLATRRATIAYDAASTNPEALARVIVGAGYQVPQIPDATSRSPRAIASARAAATEQAESREHRTLRREVLIAALFTVPLLIVGMSHGAIPGLDGAFARWLQLGLAIPVVLGPGRRFFRLAWAALKHRSADMNTLVSLGAGAAFLYSTVAVVAPGLFPHAEHGHMPEVYFEAAGAIITFMLGGKLLETRARRRLTDAVRGLQARHRQRLRGRPGADAGSPARGGRRLPAPRHPCHRVAARGRRRASTSRPHLGRERACHRHRRGRAG